MVDLNQLLANRGTSIEVYLGTFDTLQISEEIHAGNDRSPLFRAQSAWQMLGRYLNGWKSQCGLVVEELERVWQTSAAQEAVQYLKAYSTWVGMLSDIAGYMFASCQELSSAYDDARFAVVRPDMIRENRIEVKRLRERGGAGRDSEEIISREAQDMRWQCQNTDAMKLYYQKAVGIAEGIPPFPLLPEVNVVTRIKRAAEIPVIW